MQISVRSVLEITAFIAVTASILTRPGYGLVACVIFLHLGAAVTPTAIAFWAIFTGKNANTQIDVSDSIIVSILLRFAATCGICLAIIWALFLLACLWSLINLLMSL